MQLFETSSIEERNYAGSGYFGYLLNEPFYFSEADYNAMQKIKDPPLLRCMKVSRNGKTEICYEASVLFSLPDALRTNKINDLANVFLNLYDALSNIKKTGYLSVCNILPQIEKIFLDPKKNEIKFVYLPVGKELFSSPLIFEDELKQNFLQLFDSAPKMLTEREMILKENLQALNLSLKEIADHLKESIAPVSHLHGLYLYSTNIPHPITIDIQKDDFVIGRNSSVCDYLLNISELISRIHCQIRKEINGYSIIDLNSTYGTFLNGKKLSPQQAYPIKNNDTIGMAHIVDFTVVYN